MIRTTITTVTLALVTLSLAAIACKDEGTVSPSIPERVHMTLMDVSVQEAYIHISVANPAPNETLVLERGGVAVIAFAAVADTNIADTALAQTTAYQYTASLSAGSSTTGTSNTLSTQTLAPTSHNFTWQTFTLGDGNGSALYDVALVNDTLAYASGENYLTGDPAAYNLVRWNATSCDLLRVPFIGPCSAVDYPPIRAIWVFSSSEILLTNGGSIVQYDGTNSVMDCRMNSLLSGAIDRISGFETNDVYIVGGSGTIVHSDGGVWRALPSGTTTNIFDAWGTTNPLTGKEEVYCAAGSKLLRIRNGSDVDTMKWGVPRTLNGIWTHAGFPLYTAGDGVFENSRGLWREVNTGASIYTNAIRGSAPNDIFAVGDFGLIAHFNGLTWQPFFENTSGDYYAVAVGGNLVIAVGEMNSRGLIIIGRRQ